MPGEERSRLDRAAGEPLVLVNHRDKEPNTGSEPGEVAQVVMVVADRDGVVVERANRVPPRASMAMRSRANSTAASADHANFTTCVGPSQAVPRCQIGLICSSSTWSSTCAPARSGNTARTASRTAEAESPSTHALVRWLGTGPAYRHQLKNRLPLRELFRRDLRQ